MLLPDERGALVVWHRTNEAEVTDLRETIWSSIDKRLFSHGFEGPP